MRYQKEELKEAFRTGKPIGVFFEDIRWAENGDSLLVDLGECTGRIPLEEIAFSEREIESAIRRLFTKAFFVNIIGENNGEFLLSVNEFIKRGVEKLEVGKCYEATIKEVTSYGVFVLVDGVIVFVHISELSKIFINDCKATFRRGMKTKVKIIAKDDSPPYKVNGSRIKAYPQNNDIHVEDVVKVLLVRKENKEGFACEITPRLKGIVDVPSHRMSEMKIGGEYYAIVKEINLRGAKLRLM